MSKNSRQKPGPRPTHPRVRFGRREHNLMSVWLAKSDRPTPVVISLHPGGFRPREGPPRKDFDFVAVKQEILRLLDAGISVVAPSHAGAAQAPFEDAVRALQFVRTKASEWNLDKERIASTGTSSGGCLSLWLAYHQDMGRRRSKDHVARQSTRLTCVAVNQALTSVDPRFIRDLMPGTDLHLDFCKRFYGHGAEELDQLPEERYQLMEELSPINYVSEDCPATLLRYDRGLDAPYEIHHASFGLALKERLDGVGVRCDLVAGGQPLAGSRRRTIATFLKEELLR